MLVVENHPTESGTIELRPSDFLEQTVPIARDIFQRGSIRRSTIERCVQILHGYQEALRELGANDDTKLRAVATNILIESSNYDSFLNRVRIGCGIQIEPLDDGEMTRLIYLKTRRRLRDTPSMKRRTTLVIHAGPGNTRVLLFKNGRISDYTNYRLGVYRTNEAVRNNEGGEHLLNKNIRDHIRSLVSQIHNNYADSGLEEIVLLGYEIQHFSHILTPPGKKQSSPEALAKLTKEVSAMSEETRVKKYQLDYNTAQAIIPALEINLAIANALEVDVINLPGSDYERGLLLDLPASFSLTEGFQSEVIHSAQALAKKFNVHRSHSEQVTKLSQQIFERTTELHQLNDHDALLLTCAAILHECGNFVSVRAHHKHSHYIISHSEIFGLGERDIAIIALIARYHRRSCPKMSHPPYRALQPKDRIRVSKLSAILRVADALDRSHSSRISELTTRMDNQKLIISLTGLSDISVEQRAMRSKSDLFHDIFGLRVTLEKNR